jgi:hypothetical protein
MDSLSLLQAVRSYLHFSQLSAWYSKVRPTLFFKLDKEK